MAVLFLNTLSPNSCTVYPSMLAGITTVSLFPEYAVIFMALPFSVA